MRNLAVGVVLTFVVVSSISSIATAQTKPPAKAAPKASAAYQGRDLSGVWMLDRPRPDTVVERFWIYELNEEEPPMTAWGQAQYDATKSSFGKRSYPLAETNDPIFHTCTPPGFPRIFLHPFPLQIMQSRGEVLMLFEWDSMRHPIYTDGRAHDTTLGPLWMGDSIGHWEGDTLVADTMNFNTKTWLDRIGHPHSDALHVIERIRRINHDHLIDDITIDDPKAYTKPWTAHLDFLLRPTWTLAEQFCEDQDTFEEIENKETTPSK
jgi:hypothetical protein